MNFVNINKTKKINNNKDKIYIKGGIKMAILLPGGAGFIGSHTAVELLNKGREIVITFQIVHQKH